jgi:hypothetical protein
MHHRCNAIFVSAFASVLIAGAAGTARAETDAAAAEKLFDMGKSLMADKKFGEACPKLAESVRLAPGLGAKLWLADCYEQNGQTASAWAEFRDAAAFAARKRDPREKVAKKRADALEPSLAHIVIAARANVEKLTIARDGVPLTSAVLGTPIPIDPGPHALQASAPGYRSWETKITVLPAKTTHVDVPTLEAVEPTATTTPALRTIEGPPPPPPPREDGPSVQKIGGLAAIGLGVVGVGLGSFFGLSAKSKFDAAFADGHCRSDGDTCDAAGLSQRRDAVGQATMSTIAFVAGGALLVGGAVLYLTAPSRSVKVGIRLSPTMAGIVATGF